MPRLKKWGIDKPYSKDWPEIQIKPSKGDCESTGRIKIKIEPGKNTKDIKIDRFTEVK